MARTFYFLGSDAVGGMHSVYRTLRAGLRPKGITVQLLRPETLSNEKLALAASRPSTANDRKQAERLIRFLENSSCDGLFINVLSDRIATNAVRYLDSSVRRILIVHSISPGTYAAARVLRDHVHATVGVSPRVRADLVSNQGFDAGRTHTITNGINYSTFDRPRAAPTEKGPLRLLFLGRVIDADKGVFWLPRILARVPDLNIELTVAGDGPDLVQLMQRCQPFGDRVRFLGYVGPEQVPRICLQSDILLFPSRFEGLGLSVLEAMAAGCVPVASRIGGVTDFVIENGVTGFLFPIGDVAGASRIVRRLSEDRELLTRISDQARGEVVRRFTSTAMANSYEKVIREVTLAPPQISEAMEFAKWRYPRGLRPGFRTYLPEGIKNMLRTHRERIASWR